MALKHLIMCLLVASVLSGCGPTPEEIKNTVKITCNIVGESQNVDAAVRIREVNLAREKIKAKPFLGTEADIIEAAKFGLCENLVADDPEFGSLIEEQREIAAKEKAEEERIAAELLAKQQAEKEGGNDSELEADTADFYRVVNEDRKKMIETCARPWFRQP